VTHPGTPLQEPEREEPPVPQADGGRVTDDDVDAATEAGYRVGGTVEDPDMRAALATAFRPGGVVARAVADELDRLALATEHNHGQQIPASILRQYSAEWREGRR
jgi:hypothetical protein